jgi:hypothetical protein
MRFKGQLCQNSRARNLPQVHRRQVKPEQIAEQVGKPAIVKLLDELGEVIMIALAASADSRARQSAVHPRPRAQPTRFA